MLRNISSILFITLCLTSCENYKSIKSDIPEGMVWVESKSYLKGAKSKDKYAMNREMPSHNVYVDGFFIDKTEVTNNQFQKFVDETNYLTIAEREIDWEEMKKTAPPGTEKPPDSILQPGSLIFHENYLLLNNEEIAFLEKNWMELVDMNDYMQWWEWKIGANWKAPRGPGSNIEDKGNYPVVHIAYEDAKAYCEWANRRLPTEAEWESAAQGSYKNAIYTWGDNVDILNSNANTWQGSFPINNQSIDGYKMIAPVKSYPPNSIGIFDMIGNVWEITDDLYNENYYKELDLVNKISNPKGASSCYNPSNPYEVQYVMKGGSFLCHDSYCASYRISARMGVSIDSGSDHKGFRTVVTPEMLLNK
tara:strand:- start:820 stop:1908 length:1089 start_codon:yes stop_codon:yes gene_type:complete